MSTQLASTVRSPAALACVAGPDGVAASVATTGYAGLGPTSAGNTLRSAQGAGLADVGNNTALAVLWRQTGAVSGTHILASYGDATETSGWMLYVASGVVYMLRYGGSAITMNIVALAAGSRLHCAVFAGLAGGTVFTCVDGLPLGGTAAYAAAGATARLDLGARSAGSGTGYSGNAQLVALRRYPRAFAFAELVAHSQLALQAGSLSDYGADLLWDCAADYDPSASTSTVRGTSPVVLTRTGTVAKTTY